MSAKKISGILLVICGIILVCVSLYIKNQVEEGKIKIANAQESVDQGNSLFSLNPATKEIGKGVSAHAQKKIDEGSQEAAAYSRLSFWMEMGGAILIILGAGILFIGRKK